MGTELQESIESTLSDDGFKLSATLVRDEFNGRNGASVWAVTITRNGQSLQTEFSHGCAYRHYPGGRPIRIKYNNPTMADIERYKRSKPDKPTLTAVMGCIVSDAQCVAAGQTFEDFAVELGYDSDSREAERIFHACRDIYFGLRRLGANLDELSELFQDY